MPAWQAGPRADLQYLLSHPQDEQESPLQYPMLSHWLYNTEHDRAVCHIRHRGLDRTDRRVKVVFVPCYLNGLDGILDQSYYDLLVGMDLTIYPSYYEPWGYTPLESVRYGVPTITTTLAGFGLWAEEEQTKKPSPPPLTSPCISSSARIPTSPRPSRRSPASSASSCSDTR